MSRISLDVESVLADCSTVFLREYNEKHGTDWWHGDWDTWSFGQTDITVDEYIEMTAEIWQERWQQIPPCEGGLPRNVERLSEEHEVDIVTARVGCDDEIQAWLEWAGITAWNEFHSCEPGTKWEYDYDVFIDDSPNMHDNISRQYLIRRPYNLDVQHEQGVIPVNSVSEAVDLLTDSYNPRRY